MFTATRRDDIRARNGPRLASGEARRAVCGAARSDSLQERVVSLRSPAGRSGSGGLRWAAFGRTRDGRRRRKARRRNGDGTISARGVRDEPERGQMRSRSSWEMKTIYVTTERLSSSGISVR